jgi:hypothetical protein
MDTDAPAAAEGQESYPNDAEHLILTKQLQAALDISKGWAKAERYDISSAGVYKQCVLFLAMDPVSPMPFPKWLVQKHLAYEIEADKHQQQEV